MRTHAQLPQFYSIGINSMLHSKSVNPYEFRRFSRKHKVYLENNASNDIYGSMDAQKKWIYIYMCIVRYTLLNEFSQNKSNHDWMKHINTNAKWYRLYYIEQIYIYKTSTLICVYGENRMKRFIVKRNHTHIFSENKNENNEHKRTFPYIFIAVFVYDTFIQYFGSFHADSLFV